MSPCGHGAVNFCHYAVIFLSAVRDKKVTFEMDCSDIYVKNGQDIAITSYAEASFCMAHSCYPTHLLCHCMQS